MAARPITNKQAVFVAEFLVDLNATQAAIRAGYSKKNASRIAVELLNKTQVAQAIAEEQSKRAAKTGRTAFDVLKDIQDVTRAARDDGDLKTALKGLEMEGKHLGMFTDRVQQEISGPSGGPVQTELIVRFVEPNHADAD